LKIVKGIFGFFSFISIVFSFRWKRIRFVKAFSRWWKRFIVAGMIRLFRRKTGRSPEWHLPGNFSVTI